jgi:hypothetical protein
MFGRAGPLVARRAPALDCVAGRSVSFGWPAGPGRETGAFPVGVAVEVPAASGSSLSFLIPSFSRILLKKLMTFPFYGLLD